MKNGELKIQKGVPIPKKKGRDIGEVGKALQSMKRGDSIAAWGSAQTVAKAAKCYFGKGNYAYRTTPEGGRLWRVK